MRSSRWTAALSVAALCLTVLTPGKGSAQTVSFNVTNAEGGDTIYANKPAELHFSIDAPGIEIAGISWPIIWRFTNGNIVGPLTDGVHIFPSDAAVAAFENIAWVQWFSVGSDPDTSLYGFVDFGGPAWIGSGLVWRAMFTPSDTGHIILDSTYFRIGPAVGYPNATAPTGYSIPSVYEPVTIVVAQCPVKMGDNNEDGVINSADLIYMVNYVFKSGPEPLPMRTVGDVNCSGGLGGSDVIYMVNFLFKSGAPPCGCYVRII